MHRFFIPPELANGPVVTLTESEAHHARQVLRLRESERVTVLNGHGSELLCEVIPGRGKELALRVVSRSEVPAPAFELVLIQAVPKGKSMDVIVQKATELGVKRIVPILSERTAVHLDSDGARDKQEKWRDTCIEAMKQCGNPWLPQVEVATSPKAYLARNEKIELNLIASLQSDGRHPREYFQRFAQEHGMMPKSVAVWVGPEGDFTPAEINSIKSAGALPITLGRLVLRSETAAVYCLSVLNYEMQTTGQKPR